MTMRGFIVLAMELMMCRAVEEAWEMVCADVLVSTQLPVLAERNNLTWLASIRTSREFCRDITNIY